MKKNYSGLIFTFAVICLLTVFTPVRKVIKSVLNDVSEGNNSGKTITARFTYTDSEGNPTHTEEKLYVFITDQTNGQGSGTRLELSANGKTETINKIYDQNWNSNVQDIQGNRYYVTVATAKEGKENEVEKEQKYEQNRYDVYNSGDVYNGSYTINFPSEIDFDDKDSFELKIEIKGIKGEKISLDDMLSPMNTATRFGIFALTYKQSADVEATIGVKQVLEMDTHSYGLSSRNFDALKIEKNIKVDKKYKKNNEPLNNKDVNILLLQNNETIQNSTCTTDTSGKCSVEFKNVENGIYTIAEQIDDKIISTSQTIEVSDLEKIDVLISGNNIEIKDFNESDKINYNYNYVESVGQNTGNVHLEKMRNPGTLVLGTEELYNKYKEDQEFKSKKDVVVALVDEDKYKRIDFTQEFNKLNELSKTLATAIDSDDVKVYYTTADKIETAGINFKSEDKEYILVNVDCSNKTEVKIGGRHKRDGKDMVTDSDTFAYNEGAKVIYNFYTIQGKEISPYSHSIKTEAWTSGIILAPDADVEGASGNHSGTIIAKDYNHKTGEVHQKVNPNGTSSSTTVNITNNITTTDKPEEPDEPKEPKVVVEKVNTKFEALKGAKMQLLDSEGKKVLEEWTTDGNIHDIKYKLEVGSSYIIREVEAPVGYQLAKDYTFTVKDTEELQKHTIVDTQVKISKYDNKGNYLSGALLRLVDQNGNVIEEWTTTDVEHIVKEQLKPGNQYTLKEIVAPEGYKVALDAVFTALVGDEDQVIVMTDDPQEITVKISKYNTEEKLLAGAELQILDSKGNVVEEWTSEEASHLVQAQLQAGEKYTLHEKNAPEGYEKAEDINFEVQGTGKEQEIKMVDKRIKRVAGVVETYDGIIKYTKIFSTTVILLSISFLVFMKFNKKKFSK